MVEAQSPIEGDPRLDAALLRAAEADVEIAIKRAMARTGWSREAVLTPGLFLKEKEGAEIGQD